MKIKKEDIEREVLIDEIPDLSYIKNQDRLDSYGDEWIMEGIRAKIILEISYGSKNDLCTILQTITSPGLWGIESDCGEDYKDEVFQEEKAILIDVLRGIGVEVI